MVARKEGFTCNTDELLSLQAGVYARSVHMLELDLLLKNRSAKTKHLNVRFRERMLVVYMLPYRGITFQVQGVLEREDGCGACRDGEAVQGVLGLADQVRHRILTPALSQCIIIRKIKVFFVYAFTGLSRIPVNAG